MKYATLLMLSLGFGFVPSSVHAAVPAPASTGSVVTHLDDSASAPDTTDKTGEKKHKKHKKKAGSETKGDKKGDKAAGEDKQDGTDSK